MKSTADPRLSPSAGWRRNCEFLESETQGQLDQARLVALRADDTELRGPKCRSWIAELHTVRDVKNLRAELHLQLVFRSEPGILKQREVEIVDALRAQYSAACGARWLQTRTPPAG